MGRVSKLTEEFCQYLLRRQPDEETKRIVEENLDWVRSLPDDPVECMRACNQRIEILRATWRSPRDRRPHRPHRRRASPSGWTPPRLRAWSRGSPPG